MKLIFVRHAEPDYSIDGLTDKGKREARCLLERTKHWKVDQFYASPLGRAQQTAAPTLEYFGIPLTCCFPDIPEDRIQEPDSNRCIVYPWLREVHAPFDEAHRHEGKLVSWDFLPRDLNQHPEMYEPNQWRESSLLHHCDFVNQADWIYKGIDGLLARHGLHRDGMFYRTSHKAPSNAYMKYNGTTLECMKEAQADEPVIVIFCHLGVMMTMMSHLLNVSPHSLLQGLFVPPASVTVLMAEEREAGYVLFRAQVIGDTSHLTAAGEPVSFYGGFDQPFQG